MQKAGVSMQEIMAQAVEAYQRKQFIAEANASDEALRDDPEAWQAYQAEMAEWDATLADGLEEC